ncbi:hypothetical protein ABPG77_009383 [Micractinium sp. CCAP 211/92]
MPLPQAETVDWLSAALRTVEAQLAVWEGASEEQQRRNAVTGALAAIASASDWQSAVNADDPEFRQALMEAIPSLAPAEAALCMRACADLKWELEGTLGPTLHALLLRTLPCAEPAQVAHCLTAWSCLGGSLDGELAATAVAAVQRGAPHMHSQALLRTLTAFEQAPGWRRQLSSDAILALRQGLLRMLPSMAPLTVHGCLMAWSQLAGGASLRDDPELTEVAEAALLRVLPALSPQRAGSICDAAKAAGWGWGEGVEAQLAHRATMEEQDWRRLDALFSQRYSLDPSDLPLPGDPALVCAVKEGDLTRLHSLLYFGSSIAGEEGDGGPGVDAADAHGATALIHAAIRGDIPAARLLLEGRLEYTALGLAACHGHTGMVRLLLGTGGADPNARAHDGRTPLMAAVLGGQHCREIVRQLAAAGADLDTPCDALATPLELALDGCRPECAAALLREGASPAVLPPHQLARLQDLLSTFDGQEPVDAANLSEGTSSNDRE